MQIMKLAAIAVFGVSVLGFSTMTSTGCSSTEDTTCDPELEDCGSAGTTGDAGSGGSAGSSDAGTGGTGATTGSDSATKLAAALGAPEACATCLDSLSGSVKDGGGQDNNCTGIAAACDNDQACVNLVTTAGGEKSSKPSSTPTCWFGKANELVAENASPTSDAFYACAVFGSCAASCGNLTNQTEACQ